MIILSSLANGRVTECRSDDGLVLAKACPITTLFGDFSLVDTTSERSMSRGEYLDYSRPLQVGTSTGERVPAHIWESACKLMAEWNSHQRSIEDAAQDRAIQIDAARHTNISDWLTADMERAASDN